MKRRHDMPFGPRLESEGGVTFRLWAPAADAVDLALGAEAEDRRPMRRRGDGWYELYAADAGAGTLYQFRIGDLLVPDPASRFQSQDVHGPSEVIDPDGFDWPDAHWQGRPWEDCIFYELHVGSFTPDGTFAGVIEKLDTLKDLGVTAVELMPVADFPGRRNWGYDGVFLFAPEESYGRPDDLKHLIAEAHHRNMMVFLDVVYNHFGPEGNYLHTYAPQFFTDAHETPWGAAIDFEGPDSHWVREFFIHNALYWIHEYGVDGLRLDAVHAVFDQSMPHILNAIARRVRQGLPADRHVHLVLENDKNQAHFLTREDEEPIFYVAQWNDDIHHALQTALTGEKEGYYIDYADDPVGHLIRCLQSGFAYQGEASPYRGGANRGEPSGHLPPAAFVSFLQNHDQVGNRAFGERIHHLAEESAVKAAVAIYLLAPHPPLIFMGEEWGAETPFQFFTDFGDDLADPVREGRRSEFRHFKAFADPEARARIPDPQDARTFHLSCLNWGEAESPTHADWREFYVAALAQRHVTVIPRLPAITQGAAVERFGERAFRARWRAGAEHLTLWANLSDGPCVEAAEITGNVVFAHAFKDRGASWPPWMVVWTLESGNA